jgi:sulfur relay protein TusB/DsrH
MKKILYLYGFNMRNPIKSSLVLNLIKKEINLGAELNLVLLHDGVIGISKNENTPDFLLQLIELPVNLFALKPDLLARGLDPNEVFEKLVLIDYDQLVDLLVDNPIIASWL